MKVIDYQNVDMTDQEFEYYQELIKQCSTDKIKGQEYFKGLFKTDDQGFITLITPNKSIPWAILFFIQQIMISQRLRIIDNFRNERNK